MNDTSQAPSDNTPDLQETWHNYISASKRRLSRIAEAMGAKMDVRGLPGFEKRHESMGPGNSSDKARRMSVTELREALSCAS